MTLSVGILKETAAHETRVAATPETVKKLIALGAHITVQTGAGLTSSYSDTDYQAAGATIAADSATVLSTSDIVFTVQPPDAASLQTTKTNLVLVGLANPTRRTDVLNACAERNITLMGMELVPRITRAQSMDALSSQANLGGYRAVLEACAYYGRAMPMMMTAAGTISAAKVFVMGAGVAGLQAIATARRLGAIVSATDVRPVAREQVMSLGAKFVMVEDDETKQAETSGGYARDMSDVFKQKQAALIAETIKKQDIVITTALIPGRPAPRLVTLDMIKTMRAGSVLVDMAVEAGGNIEGSVIDDIVDIGGVIIIGTRNLPGRIATDASALYARNLLALFNHLYNKDNGTIVINLDDEITKAMTLTQGGKIVHPNFIAKD
jgi:H+-translocating NAD(P) transhydrogenase subunit alpha